MKLNKSINTVAYYSCFSNVIYQAKFLNIFYQFSIFMDFSLNFLKMFVEHCLYLKKKENFYGFVNISGQFLIRTKIFICNI